MKGLYFTFINDWIRGEWLDWRLILISFEYDKWEPCLSFRLALFGLGFEIAWACLWETEESKKFKEAVGQFLLLTDAENVDDTSV